MENGRLTITTDLIPTGNIVEDKRIIPIILKNTIPQHNKNVEDIKVLFDYYYNKTDVLKKSKVQQPQINNKIGIAYANMAVTTINAYCFANPLTFSSRSASNEVQEKIKLFNDCLDDDNYNSKTALAELKSGICGLGYKFISPPTPDDIANGRWVNTTSDIDPTQTFVIRANTLKKEKVMAVHFYTEKKYNAEGTDYKQYQVYNVWTKYHYWVFEQPSDGSGYEVRTQIVNGLEYVAYPLINKKIPLIEYPRKQDRTSDFEIGKAIIDSINALASSRVDDVQQSVDYILLLRDIDIESEGAINKIKEFVQQGILSFKSNQNALVQPNVSVLDVKLNQSEVQKLQDFLCDKLEEVLNIPNRETRSSGGDTGSAVESRNGFRSLENIAGLVTLSAKEAENETLDVILSIANTYENCPFRGLKPSDIEIKANRNKVENIATNTAAYATLKSAGMNDVDALTITQLTPDAISTADRNKKYAEENKGSTQPQEKSVNQNGTTTEK